MSKDSLALLATTVLELVELVLSHKSIVAINLNDLKLKVTYSDNSSIFIDLPVSNQTIQQTVDLSSIENNVIEVLKDDIALKFEELKKSFVYPTPTIIKGEKGDVGERGKDANQEYIIDSVLKQFKEELGNLDKKNWLINQSIPDLIVGKDIDESVIIASVIDSVNEQLVIIKENINAELQLNLRALLANNPLPKDGKDADEVEILNRVLEKANEVISVNKEDLRVILQEYILEQVKKSLDHFKPIIPLNGKDGKDADDRKIIADVLAKVTKKLDTGLKNAKTLVKEEIKHGLQILKESIPKVRDGIDGRDGADGKDGRSIKGEKGDKGDTGNGIKNAEVDNRNHLIIETTEKVIDAGKIQVKQIFSGGFGFNYTNSAPMPFDVGLIPKGTKFKDTDLKVLFTKLLYGYNFPKFVDFLINGLLNNVEIGYSIIAGDYQASFTIQDPELLRPDSITILKEGQILLENLPNVSPVNVTLAGETKNTIDVISFEIFAYDTTGVSFNKYFTVNCKYRIYYGEYTEDITDTGFPNPLIVLRASELVIDIYGEYFFQNIPLGANYKWFCYPSILGENYVFYDTVSDIALILNDVLKINIVNEYGLVIEYNCYRTLNEINEDIIMKVKSG